MQSSYQMAYSAGNKPQQAGTFPQQNVINWGSSSEQPQPQVQFGGGSIFGNGPQQMGVKDSGEHNNNASSVREYAYEEERNMKFRPQMEDTHCIQDKVAGDASCGLFAIFDGHGGRQVSDHCAERFPTELRKELLKNPNDLCKPLLEIFAKVDNELRLLDADGCGSTACVTVVRREGGHNVIYVANIGDTRAVLSKSNVAERMSIDDKCDNPDEVARIKSQNGLIVQQRVGGVLAVTRAFGDHSLRHSGLISVPHIVKYTLKPFDKYLVIASDGVWDELSDQDSINYCKEEFSTKQIAQNIVKSAVQKGSKDNISVIVLRFNSTNNMY